MEASDQAAFTESLRKAAMHPTVYRGLESVLIAVIPQYTRMKFYVRAAHVAALERLKAKIMPCFK